MLIIIKISVVGLKGFNYIAKLPALNGVEGLALNGVEGLALNGVEGLALNGVEGLAALSDYGSIMHFLSAVLTFAWRDDNASKDSHKVIWNGFNDLPVKMLNIFYKIGIFEFISYQISRSA